MKLVCGVMTLLMGYAVSLSAQTIEELTEQLQMAREAQQQWLATRQQLTELIEENQAAIEARQQLTERLNERERQLERANEQIGSLRIELLRSWDTRSTLLARLQEIAPEQAEAFVTELANEPGLQGSDVELNQLRERLHQAESQWQMSQNQLQDVQQVIARLEGDKTLLQHQVSELEQALQNAQQVNTEFAAQGETVLSDLQTEVRALQAQLQTLNAENRQLSESLQNLNADRERLANLVSSGDRNLQAPLKAAQEEIQSLKQEIAALRSATSESAIQFAEPEVPPPSVVAEPEVPPPSVVAEPEVTSPSTSMRTVTVQRGDTLSRISSRELGSASRWREIFEVNQDRLSSPNSLQVGMELVIP